MDSHDISFAVFASQQTHEGVKLTNLTVNILKLKGHVSNNILLYLLAMYMLASVAQLDVRPTGDQEGRYHSSVEIDHEIFSAVILFLLLIQEVQLSVSGKKECAQYWLTA